MEKVKNISLKMSIILYMAIALVVSTILSFGVTYYAENMQEDIWFKYVDKEEYMKSIENESGHNYLTVIPRISPKYMDDKDVFIVELCDLISSWGDLFLSFISCAVAVFLFYRNKLAIPLKELSEASKRISENNLNFEMQYISNDEMGKLCKDFERMRTELYNHKKKMWKMIEDERMLRSAIAHDIRTPITIAKGNLEMIEEFLPNHEIPEDKILGFVKKTRHHIERLNSFVDMMKELNSIVDRKPEYKALLFSELSDKVYEIQKTLCKNKQIDFEFYCPSVEYEIEVDSAFIMEVEENLLNNALRYAKNRIEVLLQYEENGIRLIVEDDGIGFKDPPQKLLQAYYKSKEETGDIHYGLGLYISKTLCCSHRGDLFLESKVQGGAVATAFFGFEKN